MNGKHWRYWLPHDSSSDAFQLIMLYSGAPQALWGREPCISCFAQGLHRVMGRRVLIILFLRGSTECWDGGGGSHISSSFPFLRNVWGGGGLTETFFTLWFNKPQRHGRLPLGP
jgi:hypothetical protein